MLNLVERVDSPWAVDEIMQGLPDGMRIHITRLTAHLACDTCVVLPERTPIPPVFLDAADVTHSDTAVILHYRDDDRDKAERRAQALSQALAEERQ